MNAPGDFLRVGLADTTGANISACVVAIGNFDGVHTGHQFVLQSALGLARSNGLACYALSFEPHPRTLFKPESPVFRLTPEHDKARIMQAFGLDGLLVLPFTRELAGTTAEDFLQRYILDWARARHVVTGFNFHFGKNRQGSPAFLAQAGDELGFGVTIVEAQGDGEGELVSSSRIRRLLGSGETNAAAELLGYRWSVSGPVLEGRKVGRTLGYPTANLALPANCHLAHGIYAIRVRRADGSLYDGVASYGRRPTFDNGEALLEAFLFDFSDDLYGENITISLFSYIRGEEKFETVEALVEQMDRDSVRSRETLAAAKPISRLDQAVSF